MSDAIVVTAFLLFCILFAGSPDIHDGLVQLLLKVSK